MTRKKITPWLEMSHGVIENNKIFSKFAFIDMNVLKPQKYYPRSNYELMNRSFFKPYILRHVVLLRFAQCVPECRALTGSEVDRLLSTGQIIDARRREKLYDVLPTDAVQAIVELGFVGSFSLEWNFILEIPTNAQWTNSVSIDAWLTGNENEMWHWRKQVQRAVSNPIISYVTNSLPINDC